MAMVLAATGLFVYIRLGAELDHSIRASLESRAADVTTLIQRNDENVTQAGSSPLAERGNGFAQIVDPRGRVVDATPPLRQVRLLSDPEWRRAMAGRVFVTRTGLPDVDGSARLLAVPVAVRGQQYVAVVGASLEGRQDALGNVETLLLAGGIVALAFAALAAYAVTAAALRPVERMRRRAAAISHAAADQRLPVPAARDEIGRLGATLNEMLDRLEVAFARERTFVADASHELRTPLAILRTELDLALRRGRRPGELRDALRSAAEETDRLSQLAEDLLVIARTDHGELPVRREALDADDVLESVRRRFEQRARELRRLLRVELREPLRLDADRLRIEQAIGNLVDNALRHGGGPITLTASREDGAVEFHVRDEGEGFPDGLLSEAFERFTRADAARGRGGAGLGLAIVAAVASAHGGRVGAVNRPGGGGDVWIGIPVEPASPDPSSAPHPPVL